MKTHFDRIAGTWDQKQGRLELASDVAAAIRKSVALTDGMDILDYGCGTGLLALLLQPHVRSVTGVDTSRGMLDVFAAKVRKGGLINVRTVLLGTGGEEMPSGPFHLITCSMTLHHVEDPAVLIRQFYDSLHPGGRLCIADLDPEWGRFHGSNDGVFHPGFERPAMVALLTRAGFGRITDETAAVIEKEVPGETGARSFSVFLVTGQK